jgi:phosphohistidine swiveling domain-containing protein
LAKVDILVLPTITEDMQDILPQVKGCILETRSRMSIEDIMHANPEIVIVADVERALEQFENGQYVSIDGLEKIVYEGLIQG